MRGQLVHRPLARSPQASHPISRAVLSVAHLFMPLCPADMPPAPLSSATLLE